MTPSAIAATFAGPASTPIGAAAQLVALPTEIPDHPSFSGLRMNFQGFVLDPAAAGGFCTTAGLETWIL